MDIAVTILRDLSENLFLMFSSSESMYGIATSVRYSHTLVMDDQLLLLDPCFPRTMSYFSCS